MNFRYPVHFTRDLFAAENPIFRDVIGRNTTVPPPKLLVALDRGCSGATPTFYPGSRLTAAATGLLPENWTIQNERILLS